MPAAPEPKLDALIQDCSLQSAQACFRKLCPGGFKRQSEELENPDAIRFTSFTQFGELPLDGDILFFAYADSGNDLTERSARKAQFDAARDLLKARGEYDAGIFIFRGRNGAFRLSYITKIYKGSKADFSHFRRYTYFVDPATDGNGTFIRQIGSCSFDSLDAIQEAFSVEAINKDFYKELANWYFWAMKHVHFPTDDIELQKGDYARAELIADKRKVREHDAKNLIRLLTRMLFVWFIKQRGLVPHDLFNAEAVARDYLDVFSADYLDGFDATSSDSRYYKAILQNLFFAALNQERGKREFRKMGAAHRDNMCLMRYKDAFKNPQRFLDTVEATTPFLNGGLFECLDFLHPTEKGPQGGAKKCYEDGFSDHKDNPLVVPDFLFFAPEHKADLRETWGIDSKKNESVQGLIHILNRYNFTIVENSPIEQEVALDPELLGKVFENLLASYNPETQTTARKQTGSFYTPRPIVDYMVDESLKSYLLKPLTEAAGMSEEDAKVGLDLLFSYEEVDKDSLFEPEQVDVLIRAIDQCKILDPACGSGAFPMGILQKLVFVLSKLDPDNEKWEQQQIDEAQMIEDKQERRERIREIMQDFEDNDDDYGRKLYLIENCLYGVDIQSIATQVSKLRFFISLVVDQNIDPDHADGNFGVRPLPNLETKFVAADTLIAIDKPGAQAELSELTDVKKLQGELQGIRHKIFSVKTTESKQKHKVADKAKREEIATALKANGWPDDTADRLAKWDPYKQNDSADFFDPDWMFGLKGFDVVIGNPPYIDSEAMVNLGLENLRTQLSQTYEFCTGNWDIYIAFFDRGLKLRNDTGVLSYITPDKWLSKPFGESLRQYVWPRMELLLRSGRDVFESVNVDSIVILIGSSEGSQTRILDSVSGRFEQVRLTVTEQIAPPYYLDQLFSLHYDFIQKLEEVGWPLSKIAIAENACATSDAYKLKDLVKDRSETGEDYYKLINTGTIGKYSDKWGTKKITYLGLKLDYPVVPKRLFHEVFPNSYGSKADKPKIIIKGLNLFDGCIDPLGEFIPGKTTLIVKTPDVDMLFALLCILNSPLPLFYFREKYPAFSYNKGTTFTKDMINAFPVPLINDATKIKLKKLAIIAIDKTTNGSPGEIVAVQKDINAEIAKLYSLTKDECETVSI